MWSGSCSQKRTLQGWCQEALIQGQWMENFVANNWEKSRLGQNKGEWIGQSSELTAVGVTFQRSYSQVSYLKALIMQYADFKIYIVWYTKQCLFTLFPNVKNKFTRDESEVKGHWDRVTLISDLPFLLVYWFLWSSINIPKIMIFWPKRLKF